MGDYVVEVENEAEVPGSPEDYANIASAVDYVAHILAKAEAAATTEVHASGTEDRPTPFEQWYSFHSNGNATVPEINVMD